MLIHRLTLIFLVAPDNFKAYFVPELPDIERYRLSNSIAGWMRDEDALVELEQEVNYLVRLDNLDRVKSSLLVL